MAAGISVDKLINRAYRLINVASADRALTGDQMAEGLECLNILIDQLSGLGVYVPQFTLYTFSLTTGTRSYEFSEDDEGFTITALDHVLIIDGTNQYPVGIVSDTLYYEKNYYDVSGRPMLCFLDRFADKSTITFYQKPDKDYDCTIKFKANITTQSHSTDLTDIPPYMVFYLEYALARMLNTRYPSSAWSQVCEDYYKMAKADLESANPRNLDLNGTSLFVRNNHIVNILSLTS